MKQKYTLKAGCIVINKEYNKIALVYRKKHNDYEFPKGHLEFNEDLKECAVRENAEEIKRDVKIIQGISPIILKYRTKKGERCKCYYYIAKDNGNSDNSSMDYHKLYWVDFESVNQTLTHTSTKAVWKKALNKIKRLKSKILNF